MAPVDSLLRIIVQQGADELRLGSDTMPRMFTRGVQGRLTVPETSDTTLRVLLGPLLGGGLEARLAHEGYVEVPYRSDDGTLFQAKFSLQSRGAAGTASRPFDVIFHRHDAKGSAPTSLSPATTITENPRATSARGPWITPSRPSSSPSPSAPSPSSSPPLPGPAISSATSTTWSELLRHAADLDASDLHLRSGENPKVRIAGTLQPCGNHAFDVRALLGDVLDDGQRAVVDGGGSVDLPFELEGYGRFRVNVYRASGQWAASIRILALQAPELASLRLSMDLRRLADTPNGLIVVCGPTGSGKSTTLAALAREMLSRRSVVLLTLEDPIEYVLSAEGTTSLVRQRQVGHDVRDFATGLRDALREDPDVLLVGEMRDATSIGLALTAAETGHLVLTTLHSGSAASALERIVDAYPPERQRQIRNQIAGTLRAVLVQRLLPRAHGTGRVAALEMLRGTHAVASLVREGKTAQLTTTMQAGRAEGMITLERSLADLVRAGDVRRNDAFAVANDLEALTGYLTHG